MSFICVIRVEGDPTNEAFIALFGGAFGTVIATWELSVWRSGVPRLEGGKGSL